MNTQKTKRRNTRIASLIFLTIVITTAACASVGARPQNTPTPLGEPDLEDDIHLEAELSIPETVSLCDPVELEFRVTNQSDKAVYLLNWYTPLEGILGDIFQVTYDGQQLSYLGPMVMRAAPLADQYILLEAGESVTAVVDVSTAYDFSRAGHYIIAYKSPRISHAVDEMVKFAQSVDELSPVEIPSQPVEVEIVAHENGKGDCAADVEVLPTFPDQGREPSFTLTGVVKDVSPSARIIWLQEEVDGFTTIVLTADSTITTASSKPLELNQIQQGLTVRVSDQPRENQALLAHSVQVVPPDEKSK